MGLERSEVTSKSTMSPRKMWTVHGGSCTWSNKDTRLRVSHCPAEFTISLVLETGLGIGVIQRPVSDRET
jgi:hypothetical protein